MPGNTRTRLRARLRALLRSMRDANTRAGARLRTAAEACELLIDDLKDTTPRREAKRVETKWRPPSTNYQARIDKEFL